MRKETSIFDFSETAPSASSVYVLLIDKSKKIPSTKLPADISKFIQSGMAQFDFKANFSTSLTLRLPLKDRAVTLIIVGIGSNRTRTGLDWMGLGGDIASLVSEYQEISLCFNLDDKSQSDIRPSAVHSAMLLSGIALGIYRYNAHRTIASSSNEVRLKSVTVCSTTITEVESEWAKIAPITDGVLDARDLVNAPANLLTPDTFIERIGQATALGCDVRSLDTPELEALEMNCLLAVGEGSPHPSKLAIMRWDGDVPENAPVALVGKGVTFDAGGISLKSPKGMEHMKGDMAGAACVLSVLETLAKLKVPINVVGVMPIVENMPAGNAFRPGDILKTMSGQTVEITNTDAEGRLILADAIHYCRTQIGPSLIIDVATLTGAVKSALGDVYAGVFSNDPTLSDFLIESGEVVGENLWELPLHDRFDRSLKSKFADMKNSSGGPAGASTAAHFIQRFVGDTNWAHIDIAGTATRDGKVPTCNSWATGYGVRLLVHFLCERTKTKFDDEDQN